MRTLLLSALALTGSTLSAAAHTGHIEHGYISLERALVLAGLAGVGYLVLKARK